MRRWMPPEPNLFKTPTLNELPPPQRTAALDLLKALLTEVMSVAEAGSAFDVVLKHLWSTLISLQGNHGLL